MRAQLVLDSPNEDGITLRERLIHVYNSSGIYDKRLELPHIPIELEYLMGWFWEIRNAVGGTGFGINPISFSEIKAWCDLNHITLSHWEISVIRKLDTEFIKHTNKTLKDKNKQIKNKGK